MAARRVYEPGDAMPEEYRETLVRLLRVHADEQRHGLLFDNLLRDLGIEVTAAYFQAQRSLGFANLGVACWADVALLHFLTEKAGMLQLRDLGVLIHRGERRPAP